MLDWNDVGERIVKTIQSAPRLTLAMALLSVGLGAVLLAPNNLFIII